MDKCEQIALAKRIGSLTKMERQTLCHLNTQQKQFVVSISRLEFVVIFPETICFKSDVTCQGIYNN